MAAMSIVFCVSWDCVKTKNTKYTLKSLIIKTHLVSNNTNKYEGNVLTVNGQLAPSVYHCPALLAI